MEFNRARSGPGEEQPGNPRPFSQMREQGAREQSRLGGGPFLPELLAESSLLPLSTHLQFPQTVR